MPKESELKDRIDKLINNFNPTKGDPYWTEFFTWPEKRVEQPRIGYRMRFAGKLKTLNHYIFGKAFNRLKPEEKGWFIGRVATAIKLVSAADRMARMGLCYPDFSDKNVMVEPFEGRMVLIDCDSLTVPGRLSATVEGTTWYRAPEIVMGTVKTPSVITDRHALAVILYYWLLLWHPLIGEKKFDLNDIERDEQLRFGQQALYIEHPTDPSNRAKGQPVTSRALGPELEKLFYTAFVEGLHNPSKRPQAFQWQEALHHTYDQIIPCESQSCLWRFFVATPIPRLTCPRCKHPLKNPQTLPFVYLLKHKRTGRLDDYNTDESNAHYVVGWPGRYLHQWHTRTNATPIYSDPQHVPDTTPCAIFEYDQQMKQWYLKNLTLDKLFYRVLNDPAGLWRPWPINTSVPLQTGMSIQFGEGTVYYRASVKVAKVS